MKLCIQHNKDTPIPPSPAHTRALSPGLRQAREGDRRAGTRLHIIATDALN